MSNELQLATPRRIEVAIAAEKQKIISLLPKHISLSSFSRQAAMAVANTPDLQQCEIGSVFSSIMKAAADGLIIDNKEAALVAFNAKDRNGNWVKKATYMPMVAGIIKKARNSGVVNHLSAHVVYANDIFSYELGLNPVLKHIPVLNRERGPLVCAYAVAKMVDGSFQFEVMTAEDMIPVMQSSKSGWDTEKQTAKGIWKTWEAEMWKKTVLKRLAKYLPSSAGIDQLIAHDNEGYVDYSSNDNAFAENVTDSFPPIDAQGDAGTTKAESAILAASKKKKAAKKPVEQVQEDEPIDIDPSPETDDDPDWDEVF